MSESEFNDYNEVIHERYKLKEQNEKLKDVLKELVRFNHSISYMASNHMVTPDNLLKALVLAEETLKSCES